MRAYKTKIISFILILSALVYGWFHIATDQTVQNLLYQLPQNALAFIDENKNLSLDTQAQTQLTKKFLNHYFFPWQDKISQNFLNDMQQELRSQYKNFAVTRGIGPNSHSYARTWFQNLKANSDLNHFPNKSQDAITLRDSNIRIFPTKEPSFTEFNSLSRGYPFDNLQETYIPAGTPIHIIHQSQDKAWYFIFTHSFSGWIENQDVAFASSEFKKNWHTEHYAVSEQDNIPLLDDKQKLATLTRIGVLYPVIKENENNFVILTLASTLSGEAIAKPLTVSKKLLSKFPLPLSSKNIAKMANHLMGKPYGWGGIYGYRDCSATTKDLMATFGLWLPRNSSGQATSSEYTHISLAHLSNSKKEKMILKKGIPFLTLINMPGHVTLYIGESKGHPIVFQNVWGVHVYNGWKKDRIVIGKTVITPLNFGNKFINATDDHLSIANEITNLIPSDTENSVRSRV